MERIKSFQVDHRLLNKGVYVSRIDKAHIITYDIRITKPNVEPAMKPEAAHTIEHIGATLLRNGKYQDDIIYFGPMGCMTGFYLIVDDLPIEKVTEIAKELFTQIASWEDPIPGASEKECGNYRYMDIQEAKNIAKKFIESTWEFEYHLLED